jgi:hypothetical protein
VDVVVRLLQAVPHEAYCDACVASALQVPEREAVATATDLGAWRDYARRLATCAGCGLLGLAIAYTPGPAARPKCVRCGGPIGEGEAGITEHGDLFHPRCWHIVRSRARIADSRQAARLSRELIARSPTRMEKPDRGG